MTNYLKDFKKTIYHIVIVMFTSVLFFSCQDGSKIKLGFMVPNYESTRYEKDRDFFTQKANELGAEVIVANAENDERKQFDQAVEMINQGVNVLSIIAVNQNTAAAIVREANKRGVKVIAYERIIQNSDVDYYITYDSKIVGQKMAEYALTQKPEGNYIIIGGDKTDKNAVLVKTGQKEIIEAAVNSGKIKLLYDVYVEDWSNENAFQSVKKFLTLSSETPDVILSSNDGMAGAAINALSEVGLAGNVLVTGQDAELDACKRILSGTQVMTIYKSLKQQGEMAAILAVKAAKGEQINELNSKVYNGRVDVPSIMLVPVVVDKSNLKQVIIGDGVFKESDLN